MPYSGAATVTGRGVLFRTLPSDAVTAIDLRGCPRPLIREAGQVSQTPVDHDHPCGNDLGGLLLRPRLDCRRARRALPGIGLLRNGFVCWGLPDEENRTRHAPIRGLGRSWVFASALAGRMVVLPLSLNLGLLSVSAPVIRPCIRYHG
jgi:hypothetical protein